MSSRPSVLLYGLGAIGSFYAFIIGKNAQLSVVARSNYQAVKDNGIKIISENHGEHIVKPISVFRDPAEAKRTFDFVVCANKAINQAQTAEALRQVVDKNTTIVLIQNGVGNEDPFKTAFPESSIISCVTWVGARQETAGIVNHTKSEDMQIGLFPNPSVNSSVGQERLRQFASLLEQGGTVFQVVENIQIQRWEKVVWNAAWNSITTVTMLDTQSWLNSSALAVPLTRQLMAEVIQVGQACGVPLQISLVDELFMKINALPGIGSSMQTDFKNGKPLELDVILGTPHRKARELNLQTPILETVYTILLALDSRSNAKEPS